MHLSLFKYDNNSGGIPYFNFYQSERLIIHSLFFIILQPGEKTLRRHIITHYLLPGFAGEGIR